MRNNTHEKWDSFLVQLKEMRSVFQKFMVLLREEERILRTMDRKDIADVTEKKEQVLNVMCRCEQQVIVGLRQLSGLEHLEQIGAWLKQSLQPQAYVTKKIFQELGDVTRIIQAQGKKNETLIRRTQHVVREAINLFYSNLGTGPVYQGSGVLQFSEIPGSVHLRG